MMRSFIFVKLFKQHLLCSNARLLSSDLWSSQQSEPQQFRIIAHSTSDRSEISRSSLIFPTWTVVWPILLLAAAGRNKCSSFQIEFRISHFYLKAFNSLSLFF